VHHRELRSIGPDDRNAEPANRWYVLALLTAIFTVHYVDRSVLSVVVEPVKREFGLSVPVGWVMGSV
jgi:hypothetical protein